MTLEGGKEEDGVGEGHHVFIYRDFQGGYRWSLRSLVGETMITSARGHREKVKHKKELEHQRLEYPGVPVRNATVRSLKD